MLEPVPGTLRRSPAARPCDLALPSIWTCDQLCAALAQLHPVGRGSDWGGGVSANRKAPVVNAVSFGSHGASQARYVGIYLHRNAAAVLS